MPLVHARDAAEAKVAAIGTVNPRPRRPAERAGPVHRRRLVARALDWHVREQVEFNRQVITCVNANLEALNDANRTFSELANRIQDLQPRCESTRPTS